MLQKRIETLLSGMTVREKALALTGESMFKLGAPEGEKPFYFLDGGTGAAYHQMFVDCFYRHYASGCDAADDLIFDVSGLGNKSIRLRSLLLGEADDPTEEETEEVEILRKAMEEYVPGGEFPGCFPPGILLGATWNPECVYAMGKAVGAEAVHYGIDVLLGTPNVNIHRDPLGGRLFEGYSEDPCLVSTLAPELVKGVQSVGIAANVKHFAANNQETDRRTVNEHIPTRALHEIYLPGFRACVQEGGCKTVMSAYNAINGSYSAMNPWLLTETLRDRWGFDGFVVSDWGAVYDQVASLAAGNDADMPGPRNVDAIVSAVEAGTLEESVLDRALTRIWKTLLALPCRQKGFVSAPLDKEASRKAAYDCVEEGMVLLKNENNALPLSLESKVSFFGEKSKAMMECGGGSAGIITDRTSNVFESVSRLIGRENVLTGAVTADTDAVIVTVGAAGQEGFDRKNLDLDRQDQIALDAAVKAAREVGKPLIVLLNTCGPVDLNRWLSDIDALLCLFIPGMEGGNACADALFGKVNPSGKLPLTFPKQYRDCPTSTSFPGRNSESWYGEDIFVGYRYYDYRNVEPLFPFGFGLSYTAFSVTKAALSQEEWEIGSGSVTVTATVKNTGTREGKEVLQLYIGQESPTLPKPLRELKQFKKISLAPGEEKTVTFSLTRRDFESFDPLPDDWTVEPGVYHISLGTSSRDLCHTLDLTLRGHDPYGFTEETTMGILAATPGALDAFCRFCPKDARVSREAIEAAILYQPSGTLKDYWQVRIVPLLTGTAEENDALYRKMLKTINTFK